LPQAAEVIERALDDVLAAGIRTADIAEPGARAVKGSELTSAILSRIQKSPRAAEHTA
jgi:3-isopropylmalate dehydrogenase